MHEVGPLPNHGARVSIGSWLAWGAATLFVLYQLATQNSIAAMQVALEKDLAISEVEVGIVSATFLFVYAIMQIPAGMLLDRWRPQFLLPPAALGVAGAAWLLSLSGGFWGAVAALGGQFVLLFACPCRLSRAPPRHQQDQPNGCRRGREAAPGKFLGVHLTP